MTRDYHVTCPDCGADGPVTDNPAEAVMKWNQRP